jgi:hypothetical protein
MGFQAEGAHRDRQTRRAIGSRIEADALLDIYEILDSIIYDSRICPAIRNIDIFLLHFVPSLHFAAYNAPDSEYIRHIIW